MEGEYATAKEWYKGNRRELKKYRGQWIAYTNRGVISCDRDYNKIKEGERSKLIKVNEGEKTPKLIFGIQSGKLRKFGIGKVRSF
ncbi:DUF5678 domain-containing protein [Microcoleus sp. K5-D4]|uniref:DUF5678 domain-containing protein n=1 Tax=Microcoleus sp. K5-D4 TaxID=2818801 RepID=UPI002FD5072A